MAAADYYSCDVCGGKAFYDANVSDPRYLNVWDDEGPAIAIKALCTECAKTHAVIVMPRLDQ